MRPALALALSLPLLALTTAAVTPAAETAPIADRSPSAYRLDYVLVELDGGRRAGEHAYSLTVNGDSRGQLRSGTKVPIATGDHDVQYMDVGLRISGRVSERGGDLVLDSEIERSSFVIPEQASGARGTPVLRTVSASLSSRPILGQRAVLSTLDDLDGGKRLQVEATVTKLK